MSQIDSTLERASKALREQDVVRFFAAVYVVGKAVTAGTTTWREHRQWAHENAAALVASQSKFAEWSTENGHIFYDASGGLEEVEKALMRRSELAFARELFSGTAGDEVLSDLVSEEYEQDLREEAERIDVFRPPSLPPSHRWWKAPSGG